MTLKNNRRAARNRLDGVGREVIRVGSANDAEAEAAASSPFLYTRLRARIAAEVERRAEGERWLAVLGFAWRAVPALALVCAFALALLLTTSTNTPVRAGVVDEALADAPVVGYERVVFADRAALTGDEVLTTILEDVAEVQR